jgi:hypothetical protein
VLGVEPQWHHVPSINDLMVGRGKVEGRNLVLWSFIRWKFRRGVQEITDLQNQTALAC